MGWDHDIMVHCHWEYDLRTAIQIAEAVEPIKPLWFEDPLQVEYSEVWKRLCRARTCPSAPARTSRGGRASRISSLNQGCDILHPDLRNTGGFLETKRIADMARRLRPADGESQYRQPGATRGPPASGPHRSATTSTCETITGQGGWMDQVLVLDGPYIKDGFVQVADKPGLGMELNPDVLKAHLRDRRKLVGLRLVTSVGVGAGRAGSTIVCSINRLVPQRWFGQVQIKTHRFDCHKLSTGYGNATKRAGSLVGGRLQSDASGCGNGTIRVGGATGGTRTEPQDRLVRFLFR